MQTLTWIHSTYTLNHAPDNRLHKSGLNLARPECLPPTLSTRRCKLPVQPSIVEPLTVDVRSSPSLFESSGLTAPSDLLRRLNPKHTQRNLDYIIRLAPDLTEDLLSSVDQPLVVKRCKQSGRDYLLCDYNRDGDSYRSPWSNLFDPPLDEAGPGGVGAGGNEGAGEGAVPGERVRKMEIKANEAFDIYRELYYEGGVSSVYLWNLDDGFAGVVLLKKCERYEPHHQQPPSSANKQNLSSDAGAPNKRAGSETRFSLSPS